MWASVPLGEVCELIYGKALGEADRLERDGVPAYGANGVKTFAKNALSFAPSIIIGRKGSAGEITKVSEPFWPLDVTYYTKTDDKIIDIDFLYYTLVTLNLPALAKGVKPGINRNDVYEKNINLPPLAEQQRIVARLDAAFAEIDRVIELTGKKIVTAKHFAYFAIESHLNQLRQEHSDVSISDAAIIQPSKKIVAQKLGNDADVSFMAMDGLGVERKYSSSEAKRKIVEVYKSYQYFEDFDVLFAKITPCFENGKLSIVRNLINGVGFGSSEFVVLRATNKFSPEFIYYCLLDKRFREQGQMKMKGAVGHKRVTKEYIFHYKIPSPPLSVQQSVTVKFDCIWEGVENLVVSMKRKVEELKSLKSAILAHELQPSEAA